MSINNISNDIVEKIYEPMIVGELGLSPGFGFKPLWAKRLKRSVISKLKAVL